MRLGAIELSETSTAWGRRLVVALPTFDDCDTEGDLIEAAAETLDTTQARELRDAVDRFIEGESVA